MNKKQIVKAVIALNIFFLIGIPLLWGPTMYSDLDFVYFLNPINIICFWKETSFIFILLICGQLLLFIQFGLKSGEANKSNRNVSRFETEEEIRKRVCVLKDERVKRR